MTEWSKDSNNLSSVARSLTPDAQPIRDKFNVDKQSGLRLWRLVSTHTAAVGKLMVSVHVEKGVVGTLLKTYNKTVTHTRISKIQGAGRCLLDNENSDL